MRILGIDEEELRRLNGYNTSREMVNQLNLWASGVEIIKENQDKISTFLDDVYSGNEELTIYLVGAGSSAKAASIVERYIRKVSGKRVISIPSTELITHPDDIIINDKPALLVSFGSSGNTIEGLASVEIFKERCSKLYQILIICSEQGEIVRKYSEDEDTLYIPIPRGTVGKSFAATGEFTLLLQYALMIFDINNLNYYIELFNNVIENAKNFLSKDIYKVHAVSNRNYDVIVSLATGSLINLASEMSLKVGELSGGLLPSQFHSVMEFRHGPKLIMNSNALVCFFFSYDSNAIRYEIDMLKECYKDKRNSTIVSVSVDYNEEIDSNSDYYFCFDNGKFKYLDDSHIVFLYALVLQSIAILKSINIGIAPDEPDKTGIVNKVAKGVKIYK